MEADDQLNKSLLDFSKHRIQSVAFESAASTDRSIVSQQFSYLILNVLDYPYLHFIACPFLRFVRGKTF